MREIRYLGYLLERKREDDVFMFQIKTGNKYEIDRVKRKDLYGVHKELINQNNIFNEFL